LKPRNGLPQDLHVAWCGQVDIQGVIVIKLMVGEAAFLAVLVLAMLRWGV